MPDKTNDVVLKVPGQSIAQPGLPRALVGGTRAAAAGVPDPFLPSGLVKVNAAFNLSPSSRAAVGGGVQDVPIAGGAVLALELPDGVTLFVRADKLQEDLARIDPSALDAEGRLAIDALGQRSAATRGWLADFVSKVFVLEVAAGGFSDEIIDAAKRKAVEWLGEKVEETWRDYQDVGISWIGTKALMWAIESRLPDGPGLYRWGGTGATLGAQLQPGDATLEQDAKDGPLLVFIHGTASNTAGSFGDLRQAAASADWRVLEGKFGERVYAFEHRTFSESPIENALALARTLPAGARLNVVTHSRGGLVGDLLCMDAPGDDLIAAFRRGNPEFQRADDEDRERLRELAAVLRLKAFRIERYVRVACPARGTRLASANLDAFLSGLLALIGLVPALAGNPIYSAVKRIVLEIARNRTKPGLVPGIEAMLPESPIGALLLKASIRAGAQFAVIAGDIQGGGLLKQLGVLLTDHLFFEEHDNDLVVDTDSMYAGLARPGQAWRRFEQGPAVNHFRYFTNDDSRVALATWLTAAEGSQSKGFEPLPGALVEPTLREEEAATRALVRRGVDTAKLPVIVVLPGIMGTHLWLKGKSDRIWFDPLDLAAGGLDKLAWERRDHAEPEKLFHMFYGALCDYLVQTHQVERFPYDWREPIPVLADAVAERLARLLDETSDPERPVRLLAHSMGGLVVRGLIHKHRDVWDRLMKRKGARLVMLGTPNQGSHLMVETLIGKSDTIRNLARLDLRHDMQQVIDLITGFRGALQLLPKPGFEDTAKRQEGDGREVQKPNYFDPALWSDTFKPKNKDFWFGDQICGTPAADALKEGGWLWQQDGAGLPALPEEHKDRIAYVFGQASNTACGITWEGERWKMLGTPRGDGSVTWDSGRIGGIGAFYYMPAQHGDLAGTDEYFPALAELLEKGATDGLSRTAPSVRGIDQKPVTYDAGPTPVPTAEEVARSVLGSRAPRRVKTEPEPVLQVSCVAMDLRFVNKPVMVGHYEQDPIAGAEVLVDRELVDRKLNLRHHLGLYAGPLGTATAVLLAQNEQERLRDSYRGAVVVGLGKYGELTNQSLTEAVRAGTLRYLLQVVDNRGGRDIGPGEGDLPLASLLLGYNSTTNISVEDSVSSIVRGVLEANQQFKEIMRIPLRVARLELIEVYRDSAIAAAHALQRVADRLNQERTRRGPRIAAATELEQREGVRERLDVLTSLTYWPRLIVTDADRREAECPPECFERRRGEQGKGEAEARSALAERLKFVYLGQRARAESTMLQRQPGLVERLVEKSISQPRYEADFSRTLFQLLIPPDFKDSSRQLDRMVMVVDGYTANLPWELMQVDETPLATRVAMVRQLSSTRYRARVRQTLDRLAFVLGNPSTAGFAQLFSLPGERPFADPDPLPEAEREARTVATILKQNGYEVIEAMGVDCGALEIINKLYRRPYRILHMAAHGIHNERAADGKERSGVVLSDGLLITAAEIGAMEVVPDLVFLNCCHLGQIDRGPIAYNKLAYSVSRELIEMGVRAIVCAGWAVDDAAANHFAETFYKVLLGDNQLFGLAVFEARRATAEAFPASNTWGAYQAYGDPGFLINPQAGSQGTGKETTRPFVVPDELLDALAAMCVDLSRRGDALSSLDVRRIAGDVDALLKRSPEGWSKRPEVAIALAQLFADLGRDGFAAARGHYLDAIGAEDRAGRVPIKAIEQLANLEARMGEMNDDPALVETALSRLRALIDLVRARPGMDQAEGEAANAERSALVGSAFKREAALYARRIVRGEPDQEVRKRFAESLEASLSWYHAAAGDPDSPRFRPYLALNSLALAAVVQFGKPAIGEAVAVTQRCAARAREAYRGSPNFWDAVMSADALLVEKLLDGSLGQPGARGLEAYAQIERAYEEAVSTAQVKPKDLNSVVSQIAILALLLDAISHAVPAARKAEDEAKRRAADRLLQLADRLQPGTSRGVMGKPPAQAAAGEQAAAAAAPPEVPAGPAAQPAEETPKRRPRKPRSKKAPK